MTPTRLDHDLPDWYRDAVIYQVHIKSFADGNGDGMGDFKGLISRLDYLAGLGVTALWLLPFYPSPLRDDGYDIADYTSVNPDYGTLGDFKRFVREAHARDLKVITEVVLNHTSDEHPWFQRSRKAKAGSSWRDWYVWSDDPSRYKEARVIFQDFERSNWTWDNEANAYYWHRFYSHQPDLNFDNQKVRQALMKVLDFWFGLGVDGMRLDAVPYLFERDGTNCENLPETYDFLKTIRTHVDKKHPGRVLLADANQWPEDAARYFGDGDACQMCFHFPLMPRMFMSLEMENRYPVIDILEQTPPLSEGCQWAIFLRNHDELTLEMVTDEERDYMYRIYVTDPRARVNLGIRRRLAPLLDNDRRKIELMNVLLMTLPGSPVVYYGDEIGMGDNFYLGDRDGVRTPMQWTPDQNAGFSTANPQQLYLPLVIDPEYHYASLNVATQDKRRTSLLWWMRRLIGLRRQFASFGRGACEFLNPENPKILAFIRRLGEEVVLVAVNLSRHAQAVSLELADFERLVGRVPEDLFSRNPFQPIGDEPYSLTFGPYGYYVFALTEPKQETEELEREELPTVSGANWWTLLEDKRIRREFEKAILPQYMKNQRWYGGKARAVRDIAVVDLVHVKRDESTPILLMVQVDYQEGDPEIYVIPLAYAPKVEGEDYELPRGAMAWLKLPGSKGAIYEAVFSRRFCCDLLNVLAGRKRLSTWLGKLRASSSRELSKVMTECPQGEFRPRLLGAEQSNTSILFGDKFILKLYRRTEKGMHPDLEIVRFLTEKTDFEHIPAYVGSLEIKPGGERSKESPIVLGLMQHFVDNQGDAWSMGLDLVSRFFERVLTKNSADKAPPKGAERLVEAVGAALPEPLDELMSGVTLEMVGLLGRRTAQMHAALASGTSEAFAPEPFTTLYQRSLYQSMQNKAKTELRFLRKRLPMLAEGVRSEAVPVLELEDRIQDRLHFIVDKKLVARKIRIHGDYHLGQVLYTGRDFVILDFEGEPLLPMSERRLKRSPVRDVAGMIRSLHYAAYAGLLSGTAAPAGEVQRLEPWADLWYRYASGAFLKGYLEEIDGHDVVPTEPDEFEKLLTPHLLEKALYEMGYELNNRPDWVIIPLRGIRYLCGE